MDAVTTKAVATNTPRVAAVIVLALGVAVLIGWELDFGLLKCIVPGLPSMNPLSALCFVVTASALWLSRAPERAFRKASQGLALAVIALASWDLIAETFALGIQPDQILFSQSVAMTTPPSQMASSTGIGFLLTAAALVLVGMPQKSTRVVGQYVAFVSAFMALFAIIGFLYGAGTVRSIEAFKLMALHTSWGILILSVGVLFVRPKSGPMALILSQGLAGRLVRLMIPAVILVPTLLGWASIHALASGMFGAQLALTLLASTSMMLLFGMTLVTGMMIQAKDTERRRRLETLRASEARITGILSIAADAIISIDGNQRITMFNAWAEKLFGYSRSDVVGRRLEILLPERYRYAHAAQIEKFGAGRVHARRMGERREIFARRKDGSEFPAEASISKFVNEGQTIYTVVLRDMTERHQAAAALVQAKEDAEAAARAESEFLANMSHEIRTPLNSISGFAQILLAHKVLDDDVRSQIGKIKNASNALRTIVNDVLDYARLEKGKVQLSPVPFAPDELVANCISIISSASRRRGLQVEADVPAALIGRYFMGASDRLQQVLLNLLSNAVKFTPAGSVMLKITEEERAPDKSVLRFSVSDTGIGIPQEHLEKLFQRFSQVDGTVSRSYGGTGLGLAICKRLVEVMGGEIGVESTAGKGSTFWFRLPLETCTAPSEQRGEAARTVMRSAEQRSILLVEDVELNREIAVAMLEGAGHSVEIAVDGTEAVSKAASKSYDLILMDIQMPIMDGITATEKIRAMKTETKTVPIVAMTANVLPDEVKRFYEVGMNGHIRKPVDLGELIAGVDRWAAAHTTVDA